MEFTVLGWPPEAPTLRLDYRSFAYAGKFVLSSVGKAILKTEEPSEITASTAADAHPGTNESEQTQSVYADTDTDTDNNNNIAGSDPYDHSVLAALSFSADRTAETTLCYRYVTVRADKRGNGLGPQLAASLTPHAVNRGYERLRIAVNNPFAYEAMYRAGFAWTGRETGIAELVLERPAETPATTTREQYQSGFDKYRNRDYDDPESAFLASQQENDPPELHAAVDSTY
jgi:hypothetical protein